VGLKVKFYNSGRIRYISNWKCKYKPKANNVMIVKLRKKGELLGSCYISNSYIWGLVVNPKYRNRGYGGIILNAVEKEAKKLGYKKLFLIPQDNEPKLRRYYSKFGYTGHDVNEPGYEEEDKSWWVMEKDI
jgi:N-acetylglutamate synthase-like GNAT family acetyltransferase